MGRADHVDIEILADPDISLDLIRRHCVAVCTACVVMVYSVELDLSAVYKEQIPLYHNGFESDLLLHAAALCLVVDVIENGLFRVPLCHFQILKSHRNYTLGCLGSLAAGNSVSLNREGDIGGFQCFGTEFEAVGISGLLRLRVDLTDVAVVGDPEQYISENTVVAEHILVLKISSVAPAVHHDHELVGPGAEHSAEVELRGIMSALGIADKAAVDIEIHAAGNSEERDHVVLARVIDLKIPAVNTDKIVLLARILIARRDLLVHAHPGEDSPNLIGRGDHRRLERKLIADIDIERLIVTPELPAGGYVDGIELRVLRIKGLRHLRRSFIEFEIPPAVQAHHFGGRISLLLRRHGVS